MDGNFLILIFSAAFGVFIVAFIHLLVGMERNFNSKMNDISSSIFKFETRVINFQASIQGQINKLENHLNKMDEYLNPNKGT